MVLGFILGILVCNGGVCSVNNRTSRLVFCIPALFGILPAQSEELEEQQRGRRSGDGLSQNLSRTPWQKASPLQNPSGSL